jgi:YVTN family beta-propeller protein
LYINELSAIVKRQRKERTMKRKHFFNVLLGGLIFLTVTFSPDMPLAQTTSGSFAYVVNNGSDDVSVILLSTNTVITTIPVGDAPYHVVFTPDGSKAYVTNAGDDTVSVIDTATHTVIATIFVGVGPVALDVSPDGAKVYVANTTSRTISIIDTATDTVTGSLGSLPASPGGIAFNLDGSEVWIGYYSWNYIQVYSYPGNTLVRTFGGVIGGSQRIEFLPDGSFAYVNNACGGCGNVQKISTTSYSVVWTHSFGGSGSGLAIAPDGSVVYAGTSGHYSGGPQVKTINPSSDSITGSLHVPAEPRGIAITPDGSFLYIAMVEAGQVRVVDTSNLTVIATIAVGTSPVDVAISPLVIDTTPPEITPIVSGDLGDNDWYISDVTVDWMVDDPESGIASSAGCDLTTLTTDTAGTTLTCWAENGAGLSNSASVTVKLDKNAPSASASASPGPNANGWNNTDVMVSFSGDDGTGSGIDSCSAPVVLSGEGSGQSVSGTCTDLAGNVSAPATVSGINIDKTAPSASASASPGPNANGWNNTDVTVSFDGADGLSGIAACDPDVVLSSEGAGQSASGTCTDLAGNVSAPATASDINIDKTAPALSITTPEPYDVELVGTALDFIASDALSGLEADAVATLTGEAGTSEMASGGQPGVGVYEVVVEATDRAGNTATSEPRLLVIYDPEGGFVTGGGWIYSDPGAYVPDPALEGKVNFGFVSKYKKGATVPTGQTEFQFHVADLNFHSSSYDWLVVTGSDYARFKGSGTINGMGDYKFMIWAGDGEPDTFRIKIWEEDEGGNETVTYDNGSDQEIAGGSIVIHTSKK